MNQYFKIAVDTNNANPVMVGWTCEKRHFVSLPKEVDCPEGAIQVVSSKDAFHAVFSKENDARAFAGETTIQTLVCPRDALSGIEHRP